MIPKCKYLRLSLWLWLRLWLRLRLNLRLHLRISHLCRVDQARGLYGLGHGRLTHEATSSSGLTYRLLGHGGLA